MIRKFLITVLTVVAILAVISGLSKWYYSPKVDGESYQGVVLSTGVAYFGKLQVYGKHYLKLTDVYYLQQVSQQGQPPLNLVKFGSEPQGPQDLMYINKSQVLYWYNLNTQGELYQKIMLSKKGGKQQNPVAPAQPAK